MKRVLQGRSAWMVASARAAYRTGITHRTRSTALLALTGRRRTMAGLVARLVKLAWQGLMVFVLYAAQDLRQMWHDQSAQSALSFRTRRQAKHVWRARSRP